MTTVMIRPVRMEDANALCAIYNHYVLNTVVSFEEESVSNDDFAACVGNGFGTQLYAALFDALRATQIRWVIGGIALPNAASVALHEKMGMTRVGLHPQVGFKFGRWIDVGYWQGEVERNAERKAS